MRTIVLALAAAATLTAIGSRPSEARPWYPWCAQYADRSGAKRRRRAQQYVAAPTRATICRGPQGCQRPDLIAPAQTLKKVRPLFDPENRADIIPLAGRPAAWPRPAGPAILHRSLPRAPSACPRASARQ